MGAEKKERALLERLRRDMSTIWDMSFGATVVSDWLMQDVGREGLFL